MLRYFNPIGAHSSGLIGEDPKNNPTNLFHLLVESASSPLRTLEIYGNDWPTRDGTCIRDYIHVNEYDWIGDDYDHAMEYLFSIMNNWQDDLDYDTEDYDNMDSMTVTTRTRNWVRDGEYKSENKHEVAYHILMDYFNELPEETRTELDKRLEAIGV